jgi:hypothetical protein
MPRKSLRRLAIESVLHHIKRLQVRVNLRFVLDEEDALEDYRLRRLKTKFNAMLNSQYLFRRSKNRKKQEKFDLEDAFSEESLHFNDEEFLKCF